MKLASHPLWLVGFRPFFALAMLAGLALPVLWALTFGGVLALAHLPVAPLQWHAHEMFFGFGWAVLGGFLLTATKNWVQIRGYHGPVLMFLAAAWIFERLGMAFGAAWPVPLFRLSSNLFLGTMVVLLLWTLIRHRHRDSFRDNTLFLLVLPAFIAAKALLLDAAHFEAGWTMTLALFRMAFLVMLERTLTQFMKGVFQAGILRDPRLDGAIKLSGLALVFAAFLPPAVAAALAFLCASLLALRFAFWKPHLALRRLDIGIMYLGYLGIVAQLLAEGAGRLVALPWVGAVSAHLFAFGVMGLIVPAMLVRIAKGHTGRKVVFEPADKAALYLMLLGFALRLVAPQLVPGWYVGWIYAAAACWCVAFSILALRYLPMLARPRIDGREH